MTMETLLPPRETWLNNFTQCTCTAHRRRENIVMASRPQMMVKIIVANHLVWPIHQKQRHWECKKWRERMSIVYLSKSAAMVTKMITSLNLIRVIFQMVNNQLTKNDCKLPLNLVSNYLNSICKINLCFIEVSSLYINAINS